jgi:DNA replication protein DnaC
MNVQNHHRLTLERKSKRPDVVNRRDYINMHAMNTYNEKTHLLTGLCLAACRQKRRVRFTTAAGLVNELVEAQYQLQLRKVMAGWSRYDVIAIDEVGYVPLAEVGAEFLFQVVAERTEKAAVVLTTNLPFSEWTQVIPNARLCKALLDRITDRAHILETGTESYRLRRTSEKEERSQVS